MRDFFKKTLQHTHLLTRGESDTKETSSICNVVPDFGISAGLLTDGGINTEGTSSVCNVVPHFVISASLVYGIRKRKEKKKKPNYYHLEGHELSAALGENE